MEVIDAVRHYQRSIEKCAGNEERMLHCLGKLYNLPVTVQHLQETGVGRTVNALRKYEGDTGEAAKALVIKWKEMVAAEDESDDEEVNGNGSDVGEPEPDPEPEAHRMSSHKHKSSKSNHRKEESHHSDKYKSAHKNHVSSSHKSKDKSNYKTSQHKEHSHKRKSTDEDTKSDSKRKKKSTEEEWKRDSSSDETSDDQQEEENERSSGQDSSSDVEGVNDRLERGEEEEEEETSTEEEIEVKKKLHKNREDRSDSHDSYRKRNKNEERESKSDDSRGNEKKSKVCHRSEGKTSSSSSSSSSKDEKGKSKSKERHRHTERKKEELEKQLREHRHEKEKLKRKSDAVKHDCKASSSSHKENSTKHEGKPKDSSVPKKLKVVGGSEDGIDSFSGTSFADALGMMEMVEKKKKKKPTETTGGSGSSRKESSRRSEGSTANTATSRSGSSSSHETGSSSHRQSSMKKTSSSSNLNLLAPTTKLEPLHLEEEEMEVDVDATLPTITPHYRPLPHANFDATGASRSRSRPLSEEEALSQVMSTKNQRTKVYSGVKSGKSWSRVPSLYDICIRILQENIEALEYTGGVPYDLLKPVLAHATPDQLNNLEEYNAYLVEDTDELWERHCQNKFRNSCRQEMESHREMYQRCCREREAKLKELTANIHNSMAKSTPVRQTKLAYVDSIAKPPRQVARKQAKYGTAHATASSPMAKVQKLASPSGGGGGSGGSGSGLTVHVPPPRQHISSVAKGKPRMAPLMQKTMKLAKSFKR